MNDAAWIAIGGVLGSLIGAFFSFLVSRTNARASTKTATLPPYEALARRVGDLETEATRNREQSKREVDEMGKQILMLKGRMVEMSEDNEQMRDYITEWFRWYHAGRNPPPPPVPVHLRGQLVWVDPPADSPTT